MIFHIVASLSFLFHPLGTCEPGPLQQQCLSYNFWSGVGSDLQELFMPVTLIGGILWARRFLHTHFECHEETCHKLGTHRVEGTPYRTCWAHHPVLRRHKHKTVPHLVILEHHRKVNAAGEGIIQRNTCPTKESR